MATHIAFRPLFSRRPEHAAPAVLDESALLQLLSDVVAAPYRRMTGLEIVATVIDLPGSGRREGPLKPAVHPACRHPADPSICEAARRAHLTEVALRPHAHWHRCVNGNLCGVVRVVQHGRCLAVCGVACSGSADESSFEHHVELLAVLVENFVASQGVRLLPLIVNADGADEQAPPESPSSTAGVSPGHGHPLMLKAIDYIEQHLAKPGLSVAEVALALNLNPSYLAHSFAEQQHVRMSHYIAGRRVALAKRLLATTDWQIKRVAFECGYANTDWCSQIFRAHAGVTPSVFRRRLLTSR